MTGHEKIKNLIVELWQKKRKAVLCVLLAEALLLFMGILGLFGKNRVYEFGTEAMQGNFGSPVEETGGYRVTEVDGARGNLVDFTGLALPKGVYKVSLHYETDTDMKNLCTVSDVTLGYKQLKTNGEHLYAGLQSTDFAMWLLQDTSHLAVHVDYGGEGSLSVTGLTISETNALSRMYLFWVIIGSLVFNGILLYRAYDVTYGISVKDKTVHFGLLVVLLFASMPLMLDYMISGGDLGYHLMRIEGIKDSLQNGMFPARNAPKWQQGYGYASAIFYGETLLYIAAFFRLVGFSVTTSYRMFFFVMTVAQVLIAYYCFGKIFREKYIGLLCSMLYTLSVYRTYKTYCCGSFGETFGVLFLPLLAYGFYRVFAEDIREKSYRRSWLPLTIGFAGLIQSHLLSCEMVGFFTIVLCLVEIKKVFRKETFLVLAKTVIYACLLSAWFLVPFLDYMLTGDFVIQHVSGRTIQNRGLYPAQLFLAFSQTGRSSEFAGNGMVGSDPINLGLPLVVVFFIWCALCFSGKAKKMPKRLHRLGWIAGGFGMACMLMSLSVFPWDVLHSFGGIVRTLVSSLQFPNRWLNIGTLSLVVLAGVLASWAMAEYREKGLAAFFGLMVLCTLFGNVFLLTDLNYQANPVRVYNAEGMGTGYISGAEYLPYGADATLFSHREPLAEGELMVESCEKQGLTINLTCSNPGEEALLRMPLLYYKGYVCYAGDGRTKLETFPDENFFVTVAVPAGYSGSFKVLFESPWYWRAAEAVTAVTLLAMCIQAYVLHRKNRQECLQGAPERRKK